jgi:Ca2+-transporting ATPase
MTAATTATGGPLSATATTTTAWHALSPDEALRQQGVDIEHGLTSAEADARRAKVGSNAFAEAKKASKLQMFVRQYADRMQVVLLSRRHLPFQKAVLHRRVLLLLTVFNAWMAMNQEGKAEASARRSRR